MPLKRVTVTHRGREVELVLGRKWAPDQKPKGRWVDGVSVESLDLHALRDEERLSVDTYMARRERGLFSERQCEEDR